MNTNPHYVQVGEKKYPINTSYKVALKCNELIFDETISDYEKTLAIIYMLFGEDALKDKENYNKLFDLAYKYLSCGEETDDNNIEEPDMDLNQDFRLICASFKSDYGIDLMKENIEWWDFYTYLNGLTDKCVLNRIREIRNYDTRDIKDVKEKNKIEKMQKRYALKKHKKPLTKKQQDSVDKFYELTGIKRK